MALNQSMKDNDKKTVEFSSKLIEFKAEEFSTSTDLTDYLGCGGFGAVRACSHPNLPKVVAKCVAVVGEKSHADVCLASVKREANVLVRLRHPNIVKLFGYTRWLDNNFAIILEFVDGGNLDSFLHHKKRPQLSYRLRLRMSEQLNSALSYLHNYKSDRVFCHGDLKPENVLLTSNLDVKLADFGSVNLVKATGVKSTSLKIPHTHHNTLYYAAPESLLTDEEPLPSPKPSMDMYGLSMILYELLTRRRIRYDGHVHVITFQICYIDRRPPLSPLEEMENSITDEQDLKIFKRLYEIMIKCWDKDPEVRLKSSEVSVTLLQLRLESGEMEINNHVESHKTNPSSSTQSARTAPLSQFCQPFQKPMDSNTADKPEKVEDSSKVRNSSPLQEDQPQPSTSDPVDDTPSTSKLDEAKKSESHLIKAYTRLVGERKYEEANNVANDLARVVQGQSGATPGGLREFAIQLGFEKKFFESILFLQVSAKLQKQRNEDDDEKALNSLRLCIRGLRDAVGAIMMTDQKMRDVLCDHVLPIMREIQRQAEGLQNVERKVRFSKLAECLLQVQVAEGFSGIPKVEEVTLKGAISLLEANLKQEAAEFQVYGHCLHNLGLVYFRDSRFDDAVEVFTKSRAAFKEAKDISEMERQGFVDTVDLNLRRSQEKPNQVEWRSWVEP